MCIYDPTYILLRVYYVYLIFGAFGEHKSPSGKVTFSSYCWIWTLGIPEWADHSWSDCSHVDDTKVRLTTNRTSGCSSITHHFFLPSVFWVDHGWSIQLSTVFLRGWNNQEVMVELYCKSHALTIQDQPPPLAGGCRGSIGWLRCCGSRWRKTEPAEARWVWSQWQHLSWIRVLSFSPIYWPQPHTKSFPTKTNLFRWCW